MLGASCLEELFPRHLLIDQLLLVFLLQRIQIWEFLKTGTLNSRILIIRIPKQGTPIFGNSHTGV